MGSVPAGSPLPVLSSSFEAVPVDPAHALPQWNSPHTAVPKGAFCLSSFCNCPWRDATYIEKIPRYGPKAGAAGGRHH